MNVILTITLNPQTGVSINGPIQDKILCLGLLAMAEKMVHDFDISKKIIEPMIIPKVAGMG